jgi:plasmid stabilization system protein ParE
MRLVFAAAARDDLRAIGDWIGNDDPGRALTFVAELEARCATLVALPHAFPLVPRYESHDIRRMPHGNYLVFYRVTNDVIEIVHVLHGARNYTALLFPNGK